MISRRATSIFPTPTRTAKRPVRWEIIGWMYQYYNTEPKDEVFALLKKNVKITKERIPAATQLFHAGLDRSLYG